MTLIKILLIILWSFVGLTWSGYVLSVLWGWFMVPVFHAPALRIPYAIGIAFIAAMLTHQIRKEDPDTATSVIHSIVSPAFFLLFGWIVTWWV